MSSLKRKKILNGNQNEKHHPLLLIMMVDNWRILKNLTLNCFYLIGFVSFTKVVDDFGKHNEDGAMSDVQFSFH